MYCYFRHNCSEPNTVDNYRCCYDCINKTCTNKSFCITCSENPNKCKYSCTKDDVLKHCITVNRLFMTTVEEKTEPKEVVEKVIAKSVEKIVEKVTTNPNRQEMLDLANELEVKYDKVAYLVKCKLMSLDEARKKIEEQKCKSLNTVK